MPPSRPHNVYLDYNATAPLRPDVATAIRDALDNFGNPSSVHSSGRRARAAVDDARDAVARAVGATADQVVFTSGATEANATALTGTGLLAGRTLASAIEHPSVLAYVPDGDRIPATAAGVIDVAAAARMIDRIDGPAMVAVMLVNNETGVVQPVRQIAELVHAKGGWLHCDAVQALGRLPIDMTALGADTLAISAHKVGGPKGVGALVVGARPQIAARIAGGGQERGRRAGTENTLGIVGFGAAARTIAVQLADQDRQRAVRDALERWITAAAPAAVIHGASSGRVANTICVSTPGHASEIQIIALDLAGVAVSAGAACSSGRVADSHVLAAMGVAPDLVRSAIRISLGVDTTEADLAAFRAAWTPARRERAA